MKQLIRDVKKNPAVKPEQLAHLEKLEKQASAKPALREVAKPKGHALLSAKGGLKALRGAEEKKGTPSAASKATLELVKKLQDKAPKAEKGKPAKLKDTLTRLVGSKKA